MHTIDICLGTSPRDGHAHVLLTVTDEGHAERITRAIGQAQLDGALFQCEGLVPFTRPTERADVASSEQAGAVPRAEHEPATEPA